MNTLERQSTEERRSMRKQQAGVQQAAPRSSRRQVRLVEITTALLTGLAFYSTLALANYVLGGPLLRGQPSGLINPLGASWMVALAMFMLAVGIRRIREEQRPWQSEPSLFIGMGCVVAVLAALIISEGQGNGLVSPVVGWPLAGLLIVCSVVIILCGAIVPKRVRSLPLPMPKEAREQEQGPTPM